jgi:hypothetical protein
MAAEAKSLCLLGLSQFDIAAFFGVSVEVLDGWKARHPELRRAIRDGTWQADAAVAASLFSHATVDAKVAFTWLKNRQPDLWRDKTEIAVASDVRSMTDEELADELARRGIISINDFEIPHGPAGGDAPTPEGARRLPPGFVRPDLLRPRLPAPVAPTDPITGPVAATGPPEPSRPGRDDEQLALLMRVNGRTRH